MEVNVKNTNNVISKVYKDSIADELGIEVGDLLISINGEPIHDIIEYRFLLSDEYLEVEIQKQNREVYIYEIEKDYDDDLGIEFTNPIIDKAKSCRNKCVFCFIDQLPKGMRETLYFKDDDSRLSFLQGNFVTLTNMSEEDINTTVYAYIMALRLTHARRMLREGIPAVEAGRECGFSDYSTFYKAFKTQTGLSPQQFKSRA